MIDIKELLREAWRKGCFRVDWDWNESDADLAPLFAKIDGYALVPIEPTAAMLVAGFLSDSGGFEIDVPADAPGLVYAAMIAAAGEAG